MGLKELFFKPKIYSIEINAQSINNKIVNQLYQAEKIIKELILNINQEDYTGKKEETNKLIKLLLKIKEENIELEEDLNKIINLELQKKDYIIIRDDTFIKDKLRQINSMKESIDDMIELLQENPSIKEFNESLKRVMIEEIKGFENSLKKVIKDDKELAKIYEKIKEF